MDSGIHAGMTVLFAFLTICIASCDCPVFPLNISGVFQSPLMSAADEEPAKFLQQFYLSPLAVQVISNVSAQPYDNLRIAEILS
jgi:acyl transferase domain-containing protein